MRHLAEQQASAKVGAEAPIGQVAAPSQWREDELTCEEPRGSSPVEAPLRTRGINRGHVVSDCRLRTRPRGRRTRPWGRRTE